jgi:hypothetical protein
MILDSMTGAWKMSGKKGRSGRLPRAIELARARGKDDALSCVRRSLPQILEVLANKALAGDKECAIYCADRVLGRPRLELDQRVRAEIGTITPSDYLQALRKASEIEAQFMLEEPERQLPSPTREESHDPVSEVDITAPLSVMSQKKSFQT